MIAKSRGFVIKRDIFRDTSLLLKMYTLDFGKVEGIVKGVRTMQGYARYDGMIDLLSHYEVVFYPKQSRLALFVQFHLLDSYSQIFQDYSKFSLSCSGLQLLDYIMQPYQTNPDIYQLLEVFLQELSEVENSQGVIAFYAFVIKLLKYSGFNPQIDECLKCKSRVRRQGYFSVSEGGLICRKCKEEVKDSFGVTPGVISYLNYLEAEPYSRIRKLKMSLSLERELAEILGKFLSYHVCFLPASWETFLGRRYD